MTRRLASGLGLVLLGVASPAFALSIEFSLVDPALISALIGLVGGRAARLRNLRLGAAILLCAVAVLVVFAAIHIVTGWVAMPGAARIWDEFPADWLIKNWLIPLAATCLTVVAITCYGGFRLAGLEIKRAKRMDDGSTAP